MDTMPPRPSVPPLRTVRCTRYVTPLREGGSLPAIMEADDDGLYVVKFRGAGQGPKALTAELIAAAIGRLLALPLGAPIGSGVSEELAADVVWFDAFLTNVDRTPRNPNLLLWHRQLWMIDHGAAIYTQHGWKDDMEAIAANAGARFPVIRDHVLLPIAGSIRAADARLAPRLSLDLMREVVAAVPDALLESTPPFSSPERHREAYVTHIAGRLAGARAWVDEAEEARHAG